MTIGQVRNTPEGMTPYFDYEATEQKKTWLLWSKQNWFKRHWKNIAVIGLGIAQIVAGVIILKGSFGTLSYFGMDFIITGISDFWKGCSNIYNNKNLIIKDYLIEKGIQVAMSAASFGLAKAFGGTP